MSRPPQPLRFAAALALACLPALVLVGAAEIVVRVTGAAERCPSYQSSILWVCDPILYFKPNPGQIIDGQPLNRAGFRSREFTPKAAGVYRILALGDSCTFGVISPDEANGLGYVAEPYPQRLDHLAAERLGRGRVEVLNAATPGFNTYQGIMLLRTKLRGLQPDLITVRFGWNDHLMSPEQHIDNAFREPESRLALAAQDLLLRTALYPFSQRLGMVLRARLAPPATSVFPSTWQPNIPLEQYRHNLRRLVDLGRAQGAAVWLLTAPQALFNQQQLQRYEALSPQSGGRVILTSNAFTSFRQLMEVHDAYNAALRATAAELGVPVIDMDALYRQRSSDTLFGLGDVVHPTQEGHDLEAQALYERLGTEKALRR